MKALKRWIALGLMLSILLAFPVVASAASGTCGANLSWSLDNSGTLTISGKGAMTDFEYGQAPWNSNLQAIKKVIINSGVTTIGTNAFADHANLTAVTIPNTLTHIGTAAFAYCEKLSSITFPGSVVSIGETAFAFTGLINVTIPYTVNQIGTLAFAACRNLRSITVENGNLYYTSDSRGVLFNRNRTTILQAPGAIIDRYAIPETVNTIVSGAFAACANLKEVVIPAATTSIGEYVFELCAKLQKITVAQNNPNYSSDSRGVLFNKNKTKLLQAPGGLAGHYTVPTSVKTIGEIAFEGCNQLTSLTVPSTVAEIGYGAFSYCQNLASATVAATKIGDYAFYECDKLKALTITQGTQSIGECAFEGCGNLVSVEIPKSLTKVENSAFADCTKLVSVFYAGKTTEKNSITNAGDNGALFNAAWHYEVKALEGAYDAYYCGACKKCFFLDGVESFFTDVHTQSWQFAFVTYVTEKNLMVGAGKDAYGRITFNPDRAISREEFVQVLYNATGKPTVNLPNPYPDVKDNGWYKNAVLWAKENNIANGLGNGTFGVGNNISRQDLALMLYKYASLKGYDLTATEGKINEYADGNLVSVYAKEAMNWAVTNGILNGKGTSGKPLSTFRLDPTGTATRAECATMLKNFIESFGL